MVTTIFGREIVLRTLISTSSVFRLDRVCQESYLGAACQQEYGCETSWYFFYVNSFHWYVNHVLLCFLCMYGTTAIYQWALQRKEKVSQHSPEPV